MLDSLQTSRLLHNMKNPLLDSEGLPDFSAIRAEHVQPAIERIIEENRATVRELLAQPRPFTWQNLVEPLKAIEARLSRAWSPVSHLSSVANTPELRAAYNACLPLLSDYSSELGQNRELFEAYAEVRRNAEREGLNRAQIKILDDELRGFRLSGVDLPEDRKQRFREIQQELAQLQAKFEENLLDSAAAWVLRVRGERRLAGIPADVIERAHAHAAERGEDGWSFSLDGATYQAVVTHADDRELRREMYTAWLTRASDQGPTAGRFDNTECMRRILELRREEAELLGKANFAELSLETKMADSPAQVIGFLEDLARRVRPAAQQEFEE